MMAATEMPFELDAKKPEGRSEKKEAPAPAVTEEEIEVKGKKMKCQRTELTTEIAGMGKVTSVTWTSSEIPIWGTAKSISRDKDSNETSVVETIDWGSEGAKEKPVAGSETPPAGGGDEG